MVCVVQFLFLPAIGRVMTVETHRKTRALASILSLRYRVCVRSRVQSTGTGHRTFGFSSPLFVDICSPLLYHDRPSHLLKPAATGLERPPPPHSSNTWVQRGGRWRPSPYRYARETEALFWSTASQQKEDSPYAIFGLLQESDVKAEYEGSGHQRCPIEPICYRRYVTCMVKLQGSAKSGPQVG